MEKTPRQREQSDKAEESAEKPLTYAEAAEAMDRFKTLTKALLVVPVAKVRAERARSKRQRIMKKVS